jgi:hypothetical protein
VAKVIAGPAEQNRLAGIAPISSGLLPRQVGARPASQLKD